MLSFWISFCFASFLPLKSDISGWVVCLSCPCGDPGMVMCSALHYLWSLTSTQISGEDPNTSGGKKAEFWGLGPAQPPRRLQKACSAWSPVSGSHHGHCQVRTILRLCLHLYSLSLLSSPPTNQGLCQRTPRGPWQSWCWVMFLIQLRGPGWPVLRCSF